MFGFMCPQVGKRWGGSKKFFAREASEMVPHLQNLGAALDLTP